MRPDYGWKKREPFSFAAYRNIYIYISCRISFFLFFFLVLIVNSSRGTLCNNRSSKFLDRACESLNLFLLDRSWSCIFGMESLNIEVVLSRVSNRVDIFKIVRDPSSF